MPIFCLQTTTLLSHSHSCASSLHNASYEQHNSASFIAGQLPKASSEKAIFFVLDFFHFFDLQPGRVLGYFKTCMAKADSIDAAIARGEIKLSYSVRKGFSVEYRNMKTPLGNLGISKITSKFTQVLSMSPYFAPQELKQLSTLAVRLERELLNRTPKTEPIVNNIKLWLRKSQLRQNQLKEWLQTAPQLFISDLLRDQKFELP